MNILTLGISDNQRPYIKNKIRLSNQIALMCVFIGFFYSFFVYVHYPELLIYPLGLFIISCLLLILNYYGLVQISRFLLSFEMLTMATLFQAAIIQRGEPVLLSFFCSQVAMTIIPWVLYDFQEKKQLYTTLFICFTLLFSQDILNNLIETSADVTFFRNSYLNIMTYIFAVAIGVACLSAIKLDKSTN